MRKHWQVRKGQLVRVIDGPFTGFRGEVKDVGQRTDQQSVTVAVQVYGRDTPVDLALGQIEMVT
jgi:transcription termination/antitermination protein NusG